MSLVSGISRALIGAGTHLIPTSDSFTGTVHILVDGLTHGGDGLWLPSM